MGGERFPVSCGRVHGFRFTGFAFMVLEPQLS
jgi:hypothetical protein